MHTNNATTDNKFEVCTELSCCVIPQCMCTCVQKGYVFGYVCLTMVYSNVIYQGNKLALS